VTALSGSGPAYFFYLVEAMIDAGILLGLPRALAADLIVQSAVGAAVMLRDSGEHPVQLREAVTSPGGTTIAAIRELGGHGGRAPRRHRGGRRPQPRAGRVPVLSLRGQRGDLGSTVGSVATARSRCSMARRARV